MGFYKHFNTEDFPRHDLCWKLEDEEYRVLSTQHNVALCEDIRTGLKWAGYISSGNPSDAFSITTGLRQGDALSLLLFNMVLEWVVRSMTEIKDKVLLQGLHNILGCTDGIGIVCNNNKGLFWMHKLLVSMAERVGLIVNSEKTKYIRSLTRTEWKSKRRSPYGKQ